MTSLSNNLSHIFSLVSSVKTSVWTALLLFISVAIFSILLIQRQPDLYDHATFALDYINGKPLTGNFLYYLLIGILAFWQPNIIWISINAVAVLTLSIFIKYKLSLSFLQENINLQTPRKDLLKSLPFLAFALCIVMNLPNRPSFTWLIGQFSPNVWHNSTMIFLMPFAVIIFRDASRFLNGDSYRSLVLRMSILLPFSMLAKPSFFFVFGPAFGIMCLLTFGFGRKFWLGTLPILSGAALLVIQILQIYYFYPYHQEAGFRIDPFFVWSNWSYFIPASILVSVLFPLVFTLAYWNEVRRYIDLQFTWLMLIIGVFLYAIMAENGPFWIQVSNNFGWQLYVADFLLFLVCVKELLKKSLQNKTLSKKEALVWLVFFVHFIIGVLYLFKTPVFGYR